VYIDTVSPTVAANNTSITITEGDSKTFDSLFTVTWGGITTGTKAYTLNNASTSYTNTSSLAVGTHTLKCTANKNNGTSASANVTITGKAKVTVPEAETYLAQWNTSTFSSSGGKYVSDGNCTGYNVESPASQSITIPAGVSVIKISCTTNNAAYPSACGLGWSAYMWGTSNWSTLWGTAGGLNTDDIEFTGTTITYVGVTPGKTYNVQYTIESIFNDGDSDGITISYSASINEQTPTVESY